MFFKKAKGPKDGDFVSYVEELQKKHFKVSLDSDSAKEALSHPLEHCVDKIKADHENTLNELRKENLFKDPIVKDTNSAALSADALFNEDKGNNTFNPNAEKEPPVNASAYVYDSYKDTEKKPANKKVDKKSIIPFFICFFIFCVIALVSEMPGFVIALFCFVFFLGFFNMIRHMRKNK